MQVGEIVNIVIHVIEMIEKRGNKLNWIGLDGVWVWVWNVGLRKWEREKDLERERDWMHEAWSSPNSTMNFKLHKAGTLV